MRDFWVLMAYFMVILRRALVVAWIRINKFLCCGDWQIRRTTGYHHKVIVIGDGFAEGLGDWVVMGGLAGVTRQIEKLAGADEKVRTEWEIVNRGRSGTVSADWLPSDDKSLFHRKVQSSACRDAEIFVVCLGTMDVVAECVGMPVAAMRKTALDDYSEEEMCDTLNNIREISEALRTLGKKVIICNVMTSGAGINRQSGTAKRLNRQLALYAKESAAEAARKKDGTDPVRLVKLNNPRSERNDGRAFDGLHLNSRGYHAFGSALYEVLGPLMVSVEWKIWKTKLASGSTVGTGSSGGVSSTTDPIPKVDEPKSESSKKTD